MIANRQLDGSNQSLAGELTNLRTQEHISMAGINLFLFCKLGISISTENSQH